MQLLNDDMDELFRRAGEEYPLNANGADWNKVMQKLPHESNDLPEEVKKKKDYRYLWLLLLLPIGFICGKYVSRDTMQSTSETDRNTNINSATTDKLKPAASLPEVQNSKLKVTVSKEIYKKEATEKEAINNTNNRSDKSFGKNTTESVNNLKTNNKAFKKRIFSKTKTVASSKVKEEISDNNPNADKALKDHSKEIKSNEIDKVDTSHVIDINKVIPENKQTDTSSADDANKKNNITPDKKPLPGANKKIKQLPVKKGFYYSIVIGPDISTVKFQRLTNAGYSAGLILGYQLNRKISIEAGALWDRKSYYTAGKYMDTSRLKIPMHSTVTKADGDCDMIEIPVNIKYDFTAKKNNSWFISAGISGYLMKKEGYNLTYIRYNTQYAKDYSYKNSSNNWFSIMNLSVGYKRTLGKKTNIQIAPYVKLPLKNVGIGKLPITSTGIYFSLNRFIR